MDFKLILCLFSLSCLLGGAVLGAVVDYPPKGYFTSDVTNVTWAHGVNSKAKLRESLSTPSLQMLEGDIVMGILLGSSLTPVPIMAHPPLKVSDLSVEMLLNELIEHNRNLSLRERKGIKLDYKEEQAAVVSLPFLKTKLDEDPSQLEFPIWINADILPGPVNASSDVKVDGRKLIDMQSTNVPNAALSLGWTTRYVNGGSYSQAHFDEMAQLLREVNTSTPITFPLRAHLALNSMDNILALLDQSRIDFMSPSVTLWEGSDDARVGREQLNEFVEKIGKDRVFVDLPYSVGTVTGTTD